MEKYAVLIIPAILGYFLIRLLLKPVKWVLKLVLHSAAGLTCLTLLNSLSFVSGISIPINAITTLTAGILGLPGITLLTALEMVP